jgi:hypothetical protein
MHAPMAVHVAVAAPAPPPIAPAPPPRFAQHTCVALSQVALPHEVVPVFETPLEDPIAEPGEAPLPDEELETTWLAASPESSSTDPPTVAPSSEAVARGAAPTSSGLRDPQATSALAAMLQGT